MLIDVACDHAYISIYSILNKKIERAIACDISQNSIVKADFNIRSHNLTDRIITFVADGFQDIDLPVNADTLVIAGVGGALIIDLLSKAIGKLKVFKRIIIQPQSDVYKLRNFIHCIVYKIVNENLVYENNRYYVIITMKSGCEQEYTQFEYILGKILLQNRSRLFNNYILDEVKKMQKIITNIEKNEVKNIRTTKQLLRYKKYLRDCEDYVHKNY